MFMALGVVGGFVGTLPTQDPPSPKWPSKFAYIRDKRIIDMYIRDRYLPNPRRTQPLYINTQNTYSLDLESSVQTGSFIASRGHKKERRDVALYVSSQISESRIGSSWAGLTSPRHGLEPCWLSAIFAPGPAGFQIL